MRKLGRYELVDELGRGGSAVVYLARDTVIDRAVAVKVLAPHLPRQDDVAARFQREIRLAVQLEHPHIVPIFDVGVEDDQPYIVLRLLTGGSLADRIQHGPLAMFAALGILQQVASALDAAHARKIIHRDVKPSNILFDAAGVAYLADFGIAKAIDATTTPMNSWAVGTPAFMSPEQLRGQPIDARTDEYALGIVAFTMLTGRLPYEGTTAHIITQQLIEPLPNPRLINPDLPASIQGVLERATAKDPEQRYASAGEFVQALGAAAGGWVALGGPTPQLEPDELAPVRDSAPAGAAASLAGPALSAGPLPGRLSLAPPSARPADRVPGATVATVSAPVPVAASPRRGPWRLALGGLVLAAVLFAGWRLAAFAGVGRATPEPSDRGTFVPGLAATQNTPISMTVTALPSSLPFMATLAPDAIGLAIITLPPGTADAALRDTPSGNTILALPDRTIVQVLRGRQQLADASFWVAVRAPNGVTGWVAEALLTYLNSATPVPSSEAVLTAALTPGSIATIQPVTTVRQPTSFGTAAAPTGTPAPGATTGGTLVPAASPLPGATRIASTAAPSATAAPSRTPAATSTHALPTNTQPLPTGTIAPSLTPAPTPTYTPVPSNTPFLQLPTLPGPLGTLLPGLP